VKGVLALDNSPGGVSAKPALADGDTPRLVADIDKDVSASVECAERHAAVAACGAELEDLLDDEDGLFEALAGDADVRRRGDDAHCAVLAHQGRREVERLDAVAEGGFSDVEQLLNVTFVPGRHFWG